MDLNFLPMIFLRVLFVMQHQEGKRDADSFFWESESPCCQSAALITWLGKRPSPGALKVYSGFLNDGVLLLNVSSHNFR